MNEISTFENTGIFAPPPQNRGRDELGQEDFLTLMITQFRNQDPFKPLDNGEFLGQLAQFGTVNGIEQLNSAFSGLQDSIQSEQALQAANLVGHRVLAISNVGYLAAGGAVSGGVELNSSAGNVQIDVTDSTGQLIRQINLGTQSSGLSPFTWDGRDASGAPAAAGHYQFAARVSRGAEIEQLGMLLESTIESVNLGGLGQGLTLNMSGGDVMSLSQVRRIL